MEYGEVETGAANVQRIICVMASRGEKSLKQMSGTCCKEGQKLPEYFRQK
jgi:hypothetical protein